MVISLGLAQARHLDEFPSKAWVHYADRHGLPSTRVLRLLESPGGPWAITDAGLAYYDDYFWVAPAPGPDPLPSSVPTALSVTDGGELLLVINENLYRGGRQGFRHIPIGEGAGPIPLAKAVAIDNTHTLLMNAAQEQLLICDSEGGLEPLMPPAQILAADQPQLWRTRSGRIWINTVDGLYTLDSGAWKLEASAWPIPMPRFSTLLENAAGEGLAAVQQVENEPRSGLWSWNLGHPPTPLVEEGGNVVRALDLAEDGSAIVLYDTGDLRARERGNAPWVSLDRPQGLDRVVLRVTDGDLWIGGSNGLWVGSEAAGISNRSHPFPDARNRVHALLATAGDGVWVGSEGGLERQQRRRPPESLAHRGRPFGRIEDLARDGSGHIWVAEFNAEGLHRWDGQTWHTELAELAPAFSVKRLVAGIDGSMWALIRGPGDSRIVHHNQGVVRRWEPPGLDPDRVQSLLPIDSDTVWVGTTDSLQLWSDNVWAEWPTEPVSPVLDLAYAGKQMVWAGTQAGHILLKAQEKPLVQVGNVKAPVNDLLWDFDGNRLWVSAGQDLVTYKDDHWTSMRDSGLIPDLKLGPLTLDADRLHVGTTGAGVVAFNRQIDTVPPPRVMIHPAHFHDSDLLLEWSTGTYRGLHAGDATQTRWRIDDGDWSPWSGQRSVSTEHLSRGDYTLHVQARSIFGVDGPTSQQAIGSPGHWYEQPRFFFPLAGMAVLLLGLGTLVLAQRRLRNQDLSEGRSRLYQVLENSPDAQMILDVDRGRFTHLNRRACELFGLPLEELVRLGPQDVSPPRQADGRPSDDAAKAYVMATVQGDMAVFPWLHMDAQGQEIPCEVRLIRLPSRNRILVRGSVTDISDRLRTEQQLRRSEERFKAVINAQVEFVVRWLPDGTRTFVNEAFCRYFGQSEENILGTGFFHLLDEETYARVMAKIEAFTPEKPTATNEYAQAHADRGLRWVEWTDHAIFDGDKLVEIQSVGRDVTERKITEQELARSRSLLHAALEQIPAGIVIADAPDISIRIINSAAMGIGEDREDVLSPRKWNLFDPSGDPLAFEQLPITQAIQHGRTIHDQDLIIRRPSGEERWVLGSAAPVLDSDGRVLAGVMVFPDITERKRTELAVRQLVQVLSAVTGRAFFREMVNRLASALDVEYVFVAELTPCGSQAEVLACQPEDIVDSSGGYALEGSPSAQIVKRRALVMEDNVRQAFPNDPQLEDLGARGYAGVPLLDQAAQPLGILAIFSPRPIAHPENARMILELFAIRAAAELMRSRSDRALALGEERFRRIYQESLIGTAVVKADGFFRSTNQVFCSTLGYEPGELDGVRVRTLVSPEDVDPVLRAKQSMLHGHTDQYQREHRLLRKDGGEVWVNGSARLFHDPTGEPLFLLQVEDITARRNAESALHQQLEMERCLVEITASFVSVPSDLVDEALDSAMSRVGRSLDVDLVAIWELGQACCACDCLHQSRSDRVPAEWGNCQETEPLVNLLIQGEAFVTDGQEPEIDAALQGVGIGSLAAYPLRSSDSTRMLVIARRVGEAWRTHWLQWMGLVAEILSGVLARKSIDLRLAAYREQLQALASQLGRVEEQQRHDIANFLHDEIGQGLAVARMQLAQLARGFANEQEQKIYEKVSSLLQDTLEKTRNLTFDLSPPVLYELGLTAAIDWLAEKVRIDHGIDVWVDLQDNGAVLDGETSTLMFRTARELLFNAVKHARASRVHVLLNGGSDKLTLTVHDDGVGFDAKNLQPGAGNTGFGLFSIRERLAFIGGEMEVRSLPGEGTHIKVIAPQ